MDLVEYTAATRDTVVYDRPAADLATHVYSTARTAENYLRISYCAIKLNGEAGEVAELVAKAMRDDNGEFIRHRIDAISKELGDVLWYWARLCDELGLDPMEVLEENVGKLQKRKKEGKLHGSGSDR